MSSIDELEPYDPLDRTLDALRIAFSHPGLVSFSDLQNLFMYFCDQVRMSSRKEIMYSRWNAMNSRIHWQVTEAVQEQLKWALGRLEFACDDNVTGPRKTLIGRRHLLKSIHNGNSTWLVARAFAEFCGFKEKPDIYHVSDLRHLIPWLPNSVEAGVTQLKQEFGIMAIKPRLLVFRRGYRIELADDEYSYGTLAESSAIEELRKFLIAWYIAAHSVMSVEGVTFDDVRNMTNVSGPANMFLDYAYKLGWETVMEVATYDYTGFIRAGNGILGIEGNSETVANIIEAMLTPGDNNSRISFE